MLTGLAETRARSAASRPSRAASIVVASTAHCSAYPVPPSGPIVTVSSCEVVRRSAARMPLEFATANASASVENEPNAVTPAASAALITARAPPARSSGVAPPVPSDQAAGSGAAVPSASGRPAQSSSSSTFAAIAAARSTSARMPSGSVRPLDATPTRRPFATRRFTNASVEATFWWISELANRVSADSPTTTSASASDTPAASARRTTSSARRSAASGSAAAASSRRAFPVTTSPPRARCGTGRPRPRGRRGRSAAARPCRSSAFPTCATSWRRRRHPSSATARR